LSSLRTIRKKWSFLSPGQRQPFFGEDAEEQVAVGRWTVGRGG
jgi:hypothetical protein